MMTRFARVPGRLRPCLPPVASAPSTRRGWNSGLTSLPGRDNDYNRHHRGRPHGPFLA